MDLDLLDDLDLLVDLAGLGGVPSKNEFAKRTTDRFEVPLHEFAHFFEAHGLLMPLSASDIRDLLAYSLEGSE